MENQNNPANSFDVKVFKESIMKSLEIAKFFQELNISLTTDNIVSVSNTIFSSTMSVIQDAKRLKAMRGEY